MPTSGHAPPDDLAGDGNPERAVAKSFIKLLLSMQSQEESILILRALAATQDRKAFLWIG